MRTIHEKLHALIDQTRDPILLENIYRYLSEGVSQQKVNLKDELSEADYNSLMESKAQYRSGQTKTHEEVLEWLRKWHSK